MNTNTVALIDHAARQSDRWLFLGLLALTILAAGWLFRWLVKRLDSITERHEATLTGVVERNTEALREVKTQLAWCRFASNQKGQEE